LTSCLSTMSWVLLRQKCIGAWKVSNNPQIVYWGYSREFSRIFGLLRIDGRRIGSTMNQPVHDTNIR
jgi:hypothetical protein